MGTWWFSGRDKKALSFASHVKRNERKNESNYGSFSSNVGMSDCVSWLLKLQLKPHHLLVLFSSCAVISVSHFSLFPRGICRISSPLAFVFSFTRFIFISCGPGTVTLGAIFSYTEVRAYITRFPLPTVDVDVVNCRKIFYDAEYIVKLISWA